MLNQAAVSRGSLKNIYRTTANSSASRIELSRTDVKVLAPSRLVLSGELVVFE